MQRKNNSTTRYPLAKSGRRIGAKVIDIALISLIVLSLGFAIFCSDPNFAWGQPLVLEQNWRYGLFVTLMAVIFFGLMWCLPVFWKKTIGMKAVNIAYFAKDDSNIAWGLFRHELFVWEIIVFIAFIMGWTLTGLKDQHLIDSLFTGANAIFANSVPEGIDSVCYYVGTGFSCFYGISILFLIAITIATCITSGKPAFHDKYSHLVIYHKQKQTQSNLKKTQTKHPDDRAPGALSSESLEELDRI